MPRIRVGVLGAGRIAQSAHLPAIAKSAFAELAGVHDTSAYLCHGVAAAYGVPAYDEAADLLAEPGVDAVVVAVPDRHHLALASAALRAGKHVLVEKPLAATAAEAGELAALAASTGLVLQVGAMKRHDPGVRHAAEAVHGRIGKVLSAALWYRVMAGFRPEVEATYFPPMIVDPEVREREASFKANRAEYLLLTHGAHVFDQIRSFFGDPVELCARRANLGADYSWHGLVVLRSGGLASFEITPNTHGEYAEGADVYGEHGSVRLRTPFPVTMAASEVEVFDERTGTAERRVFGDTNPYKLQIDAFARAVMNGAPIEPNAADGVAALEMIDAVRASIADGGRWVTSGDRT